MFICLKENTLPLSPDLFCDKLEDLIRKQTKQIFLTAQSLNTSSEQPLDIHGDMNL